MTKPKEKEGIVQYQVYERASRTSFRNDSLLGFSYVVQPIPLDLLTLGEFTDPPTKFGGAFWFFCRKKASGPNHNFSSPAGYMKLDGIDNAQALYSCTIHYGGRSGGVRILAAESAQERLEWKAKLEQALEMRKATQESNRAFEMGTLSLGTFCVPTPLDNGMPSSINHGVSTGRVTCSVPFSKRSLSPARSLR